MTGYGSFRDAPTKTWGDGGFTKDHGALHSLDGTSVDEFSTSDVVEVLYHGDTGEDWDGTEAAIIRLEDGRLVGWQTWWGPTGAGFSEDAYGGDAELWFSKPENLNTLILQAFDNLGRSLCGIPRDGLGTL
jgi:hypothetical protein